MKFEEYILKREQKGKVFKENNRLDAALDQIISLENQIENGKKQLQELQYNHIDIINTFKSNVKKTILPLLAGNHSANGILERRLEDIKKVLDSLVEEGQ